MAIDSSVHSAVSSKPSVSQPYIANYDDRERENIDAIHVSLKQDSQTTEEDGSHI